MGLLKMQVICLYSASLAIVAYYRYSYPAQSIAVVVLMADWLMYRHITVDKFVPPAQVRMAYAAITYIVVKVRRVGGARSEMRRLRRTQGAERRSSANTPATLIIAFLAHRFASLCCRF